MNRPVISASQHDLFSTNRRLCPPWCVTGHRADLGEEDWLHSSEPVPLTDGDGLRARLVMSINPDTCEADGPYVIVGATEYTLAEAAALATSLMALLRGFHGVDNLGG